MRTAADGHGRFGRPTTLAWLRGQASRPLSRGQEVSEGAGGGRGPCTGRTPELAMAHAKKKGLGPVRSPGFID